MGSDRVKHCPSFSLDIRVNKAVKHFLKRKLFSWYSEKVVAQLEDKDIDDDDFQVPSVDLSMAVMKHIGAKWLDEMHSYIKDNPQLIVNGFLKAGVPQAIDSFYEEESDEPEDCDDEADFEVTDNEDDVSMDEIDEDNIVLIE